MQMCIYIYLYIVMSRYSHQYVHSHIYAYIRVYLHKYILDITYIYFVYIKYTLNIFISVKAKKNTTYQKCIKHPH